jgi:hypothetical protein
VKARKTCKLDLSWDRPVNWKEWLVEASRSSFINDGTMLSPHCFSKGLIFFHARKEISLFGRPVFILKREGIHSSEYSTKQSLNISSEVSISGKERNVFTVESNPKCRRKFYQHHPIYVEFLSLHLVENTQISLKIPDTSCTNLTPVLTNVTLLTTLFKDNLWRVGGKGLQSHGSDLNLIQWDIIHELAPILIGLQ